MKKIIFFLIINLIIIVFVIPLIVYINFSKKLDIEYDYDNQSNKNDINIEVYSPKTEKDETTPFEEYIKGVVCAEMPALFENEALKAQAVCARTYAFREIQAMGKGIDVVPNPSDIGQAFLTKEELKQKWGEKFDEYYSKVENAVNETRGEIMIYNDEPILAVFHSTSAGRTENSENIWISPLPYLKSVDSKGDLYAPQYEYNKEISYDDIKNLFVDKYPDIVFDNSPLISQINIYSRSEAGYITSMNVGNIKLSGLEFRNVLGLRSANFTMNDTGKSIVFTTKGYGHGAGMSQYGAQAMAKEGYNYKEILLHYYTNIDFKNIN